MDGSRPATLVDEGLGNSSYLVDLGDGAGAGGRPVARPARRCGRPPAKAGLRIRFAADTHLHADFLSGAVAAAPRRWRAGARLGGRATARSGTGVCVDGDEVDLGGLVLDALATPGHTDEHLSFLLLDGGVRRSGCSPAAR